MRILFVNINLNKMLLKIIKCYKFQEQVNLIKCTKLDKKLILNKINKIL